MEALARPPKSAGDEPDLVLEWPSLEAPPIRRNAWIVSILVHIAALAGLSLVPSTWMAPPARPRDLRAGAVLVAPPRELTQTAPNQHKVGREVSLDNLIPRRELRIPPALPSMLRGGKPVRPQQPPVPLPEPPQVTARTETPVLPPPPGSPSGLPAPPPQIQAEEPKLAFETPGAPSGPAKPRGLAPSMAPPPSSVMEATRDAIHGNRGTTGVGDLDLPGSPGILGGLTQRPSPGGTKTALDLMSDPLGVDFKPYMIRILAIIKRNWIAVIPESARLGRQGRVQIQFAVAHDGSVPKLVIAMPSGTDALDRAAVAGVSASTPLPPLPPEFKGNQVRFQFTFSYNLK